MSEGKKQTDAVTIFKQIGNKKSLILLLKVTIVAFIVSCIVILPIPRYYNCNVELAPEMQNTDIQGGLNDIASSFGVSLGGAAKGDAISPDLYPELMKSNDFVFNLINCKIKIPETNITTTYYEYFKKYQKRNPLLATFSWVNKLFSASKKKDSGAPKKIFYLTEEQSGIFNKIKDNITCSIDLKTRMITISVKDQDPIISAAMADSATYQLQQFITNYRTSKARRDFEYYKKLTSDAKLSYEKARQLYGSYSDANMEVILQSFKSKKDDLENDMQLKYNAYSAMNTQLQASQAKIQEKTPAFTVIKSATVPIKPAGPKRMAFVASILILCWFLTCIYICRDLILSRFHQDD